jgi:hypothetical protein
MKQKLLALLDELALNITRWTPQARKAYERAVRLLTK